MDKIIITGANGCLGKNLVSSFVKNSYFVVSLDIIESPQQDGIRSIAVDLTDEADVAHIFDKIYREYESFAGIFNCAGQITNELLFNPFGDNKPISNSTMLETFNSNVITTIRSTSAYAQRQFKKRLPGSIVNFSSISAFGNRGQTAYSAAKGAINALTLTWAQELSPYKIRCNALAPGYIDVTSTRTSLGEDLKNTKAMESLVGRLGCVEEVAQACLFLQRNDYVNGQILRLDGGQKH